jgi:hypothetical protein
MNPKFVFQCFSQKEIFGAAVNWSFFGVNVCSYEITIFDKSFL